MKRLFTIAIMFVTAMAAMAQKTVYIPDEWRQNRTDTLLYKESDPEGKYTWSKTRSVESDNVIIFWDKYYTKNPKELPRSDFYYVDIDDLLRKCEAFYELEINQLGFVDPITSNLSKYKVMVLMNHTTEWTCYGGGYDFQISALWLNPSTCKPVGHSVAHEVGHSFHYMCYAEHSGHQDSSTDNTGFHLACGSGQAIWEQTAQWQACQSYPGEMYSQSIGIFRNSHNYAFSHEWHRYQSYWFHYFLCQYYGDITTVAQVWNTPMTGQTRGNGTDFNSALMKLKGLSARDLYRLYFDYACRLVTWDLDVCVPYRNNYIGDFNYRCVLTDDDQYQVALFSCPQGTGFNVIPLEVPAAGTEVSTSLTGLTVGAQLLEADPGTFLNGDSGEQKLEADANGYRHYANGGARASRGFRMGYVALMNDGSRRYFAEDSVYCQGSKTSTESYAFTVPEGVSRLWLVVAPALKSYQVHKWNDRIADDDMWPYKFSIEGTDLTSRATIYANATIDGRPLSDVTLTYDVSFPLSSTAYYGATATVNGRAAATLGTALQLQPSDIASKMQGWDDRGPANGKILLYACSPDGELVQSDFTATGYGHWFGADGTVSSYADGMVFSEFTPSVLAFSIGQYPSRCREGQTFTIRQALRYRKNARGDEARANFIFHVTVGGTSSSAILRSVDYADPTGISAIDNGELTIDNYVFDLQGRRVPKPAHGLYIQNGRKVVVR
ncbi:MAG: DUF4859 domain-containing protein [Prevotella sp.]|nr:DUF4859 domain-containing protein [Prevotella sp.]